MEAGAWGVAVISVLVAFRDTGDGERTRIWDFVRARLAHEMPDVEIVVGTDDGVDPFNKCMALNRAAAAATGDVFYVLDADTIVSAAQVYAALDLLGPDTWSRPWRRKVKLSQRQSEAIMAQDPAEWNGDWNRKTRPDRLNAFWAAPPVMVTRAQWDDVGGMDERYGGWGGEDVAFTRAMHQIGYGLPKRANGDALHLWHPRIGDYGADLWPGQDALWPNRELDHEYASARGAERMRALIQARPQTSRR
jgi:glycosyltransferase involved in cell wall biosynthesis